MKKQVTRFVGAASAGLIVANAIFPAFAAFTIQVSGNGYDSNNTVDFKTETSTVVTQSNSVQVKNNINQDANTGGNTVAKNTGADIDVETGSVTQSADVKTVAGGNSASVEACGCELDLEVVIAKNGADSKNKVDFDVESNTALFQDNNVNVENKVKQDADTGKNDIEKNTGGDISLKTGDVDQETTLHTEAGMNLANIDSGKGGVNLELAIVENGADSYNKIDLDLDVETEVVQENSVRVKNNVDQDADTGDNDIEENTGGDIDVVTGDVEQVIDVWNSAGYNALEVDGCCELDGEVVVDKNGADSKNTVELALDFIKGFFQDNGDGKIELENDLDQDADTGDNDVEKNTGDDLTTGDVEQETTVHNEAGANVIGDGAADVDVDVSLGFLMSLLEMLMSVK